MNFKWGADFQKVIVWTYIGCILATFPILIIISNQIQQS